MLFEAIGLAVLTLPEQQHSEIAPREQGGGRERTQRATEHDDVVMPRCHSTLERDDAASCDFAQDIDEQLMLGAAHTCGER